MTPVSIIDSFLDEQLPDALLVADIRKLLSVPPRGVIELDAATIHVDPGCDIDVISKHCTGEKFDRGFGSCFSAVLAIGGISKLENGVVEAKQCFAVLWYSSSGELITADFSSVCPS